jgi:hypothetical protein
MSSTMTLIAAAGLIALSTAQAQTGERAFMNVAPSAVVAQRFGVIDPARPAGAPGLDLAGERVLLGRVLGWTESTTRGDARDTPIDGVRALLGRSISASSTIERSSFVAAVRGSAGGEASGDAEFGPAQPAGSAAPFVLSLGARGDQSAILFTRRSGTPLGVGRYRISDQGDGAGEILALVMTGSASHPTGVFRGRSGWLVVAEASDRRLTGRFHIDAVGILATAPELEDRPVTATGSFSALAVR